MNKIKENSMSHCKSDHEEARLCDSEYGRNLVAPKLKQGQARGIWTYHLKKAQYHEGPLFLRPHCGQTSEHTSYSKVSNERYVHYLSNDTP